MAERITRDTLERKVLIANKFLSGKSNPDYNAPGAIRRTGAYGLHGIDMVDADGRNTTPIIRLCPVGECYRLLNAWLDGIEYQRRLDAARK
jgi:hypothetical protein